MILIIIIVIIMTTEQPGRGGGGARFSAPVQNEPGAHPASYTMGIGSFPGLKRPGCGVDHPPPSSAEVNERVELYLYSTSGPSWPVIGWNFPLPFHLWKSFLVKKLLVILGVKKFPVLCEKLCAIVRSKSPPHGCSCKTFPVEKQI